MPRCDKQDRCLGKVTGDSLSAHSFPKSPMELVIPKTSPSSGFVCCCVRHLRGLRGPFPTTGTYGGDNSSNTLLSKVKTRINSFERGRSEWGVVGDNINLIGSAETCRARLKNNPRTRHTPKPYSTKYRERAGERERRQQHNTNLRESRRKRWCPT